MQFFYVLSLVSATSFVLAHDSHRVEKRLPETWHHPRGHPVHQLFRRASQVDGHQFLEVGSEGRSLSKRFSDLVLTIPQQNGRRSIPPAAQTRTTFRLNGPRLLTPPLPTARFQRFPRRPRRMVAAPPIPMAQTPALRKSAPPLTNAAHLVPFGMAPLAISVSASMTALFLCAHIRFCALTFAYCFNSPVLRSTS